MLSEYDDIEEYLKENQPKKGDAIPAEWEKNDKLLKQLTLRGVIHTKDKKVQFKMDCSTDEGCTAVLARLKDHPFKDQILNAWRKYYIDTPQVILSNTSAIHWNNTRPGHRHRHRHRHHHHHHHHHHHKHTKKSEKIELIEKSDEERKEVQPEKDQPKEKALDREKTTTKLKSSEPKPLGTHWILFVRDVIRQHPKKEGEATVKYDMPGAKSIEISKEAKMKLDQELPERVQKEEHEESLKLGNK
jgi:hypothetical protein